MWTCGTAPAAGELGGEAAAFGEFNRTSPCRRDPRDQEPTGTGDRRANYNWPPEVSCRRGNNVSVSDQWCFLHIAPYLNLIQFKNKCEAPLMVPRHPAINTGERELLSGGNAPSVKVRIWS